MHTTETTNEREKQQPKSQKGNKIGIKAPKQQKNNKNISNQNI